MSTGHSRSARIINIIKTVLLAIIAITLVKFVFFPSAGTDEAQSLDPAGDYGAITITPEIATITNSINLDGTIQSDPAKNVRATLAGEITEIYVNDGDTVSEGDTILLIQKEIEPDPVTPPTSPDAQSAAQLISPKATYKNEWITAPASGKISLSALVSQTVNVGDTVATIQPPTFSAVASLTPDQMYRVQNIPEKATISIKNGPAPFECTGLKIDTPHNRGQKETDTSNSSTTIEARCPISSEHKVFAGLQVTMGLIAGEAKDALTIPISAVEGRFEAGIVYKPGAQGEEPTKINIKLGLTDGNRIQVLEGLTENDEILEFVPGKKVENIPGEDTGIGPDTMPGTGEAPFDENFTDTSTSEAS